MFLHRPRCPSCCHILPSGACFSDCACLTYGLRVCPSRQQYLEFCESLVRDDHALMKSVKTPFITFHSRNDTFTDPEGSELLVEYASVTDKSLVYCDTMWHALMQEDGKEEIVKQIIDWLNNHT